MTVDRIIPCVCCEHPPSVDDASHYGMPILMPYNSLKDHKQFWQAQCPKCGRGGVIDYNSPYLALKGWNDTMRACYEYENKPIVYKEDWKDTCARLGYEYHDWGERSNENAE